MARRLVAALGAILAMSLACAHASGKASEEDVASVDEFEPALARYGEWINVAPYGEAWRPLAAAPDWKPYLHGEWVLTGDGWFWKSDEPWAWACYHYGRWTHDPVLGWIWVPGRRWAPAWVTWRLGPSVIGWTALGPYAAEPTGAWVFVPAADFVGVPVANVALPTSEVPVLLQRTGPAPPPDLVPRAAPGTPRFGGPPVAFVERYTHRPVVPVPTPRHAPSPGSRASADRPSLPPLMVEPLPAQKDSRRRRG